MLPAEPRVLFLLVVAAVCIPLYNHERDRYLRAHSVCFECYKRNLFTVKLAVCSNIDEREQASAEIRDACQLAERELLHDPSMCARQRWFDESAVVGWYKIIAGVFRSTWVMILLACIALITTIYGYFGHRTSMARDRLFLENFREMFKRQDAWNDKMGRYERIH